MKRLTEQEYINKLKSLEISITDIPVLLRTEKICLTSVKLDGNNLKHVENQTDKICAAAIKKTPGALAHVKAQTEYLCFLALKKDGRLLNLVETQTEDLCLTAIQSKKIELGFIKVLTPKVVSKIIKLDPSNFYYIKEKKLSEESLMAAVETFPFILKLVENKTFNIEMAAIKADPFSLYFAEHQNKEMCLSAVNVNGLTLHAVKIQTQEICDAAINQNPVAFIFAKPEFTSYRPDIILKCLKDKDVKNKNHRNYKIFLNKVTDILSRLNDNDLIHAIEVGLVDVFHKYNNNPDAENLMAFKQKVKMIKIGSNINAGSSRSKNSNKII